MRYPVRATVLAATALWAFGAGGAGAEPAPGLSMTIYNDNMALIDDVRVMPVTAGRLRLEFKDVSAQIIPQTVSLTGPGITVIEQNFDYDLLTPTKMLEKAVGQTVKLIRTNPGNGAETTVTAKVLSVNDGAVLQVGDHIEVLRDDGLPTRIIFDKVPDNLRARPTLSVTVASDTPGSKTLGLRYLSRGLAWKADYVGLYDETQKRLNLQGWITLSNNSGINYQNVRTQLVAGSLNMGGGYPQPRGRSGQASGLTEYDDNGGDEERIGDYYLYNLPERTTIAHSQQKQVNFLNASSVAAQKIYAASASGFNSQQNAQNTSVVLDLANSKAGGLGMALPAGAVRLYANDQQGRAQFLGEDRVDHTPVGSGIQWTVGQAFDVTTQSTVVDQTQGDWWRGGSVKMRYAFRNARPENVEVVFDQQGMRDVDWKIAETSHKGEKLNADTYRWTIAIPAKGETILEFRVKYP